MTTQNLAEIIKTTSWHVIEAEKIYECLHATPHGLSGEEIQARQNKFGSNTLPTYTSPHIFQIFFHQFLSPLIYILLLAAVISLCIGEQRDAYFIFFILLVNAVLGTIQEWKAEKNAAELQHLMKIVARVKRHGVNTEVDSEALVPGDIVFLESGVIVPADMRLVEAQNLTIDESLLTGESVAAEKISIPLPVEDVPVGDRMNMAYGGTIVMSGRGMGIVTATATLTEIGKIAKSITQTSRAKTPLMLRMEEFSRQVTVLFVLSCAVLAAIAIWNGTPAKEVFFLASALAVCAIPEGLPVALTVALSIASQRMAKRNVVVRKLTAVEGLGSCTCIACDKTGTLTLNKQTLTVIVLPNQKRLLVSGEGYMGEGKVYSEQEDEIPEVDRQHLLELARGGVFCNEATLVFEDGQWNYQGDTVDLAFLAFAYKVGVDVGFCRDACQAVAKIPYESEKKYAAVFYQEKDKPVGIFKGAPEVILPLCVIDKDMEAEVERLTHEGYRVIAIAKGVRSSTQSEFHEEDYYPLSLLGIVGLIDPVRPEAKAAVAESQKAGIRVLMITGDHPETAYTIAHELGIIQAKSELITGPALEEIGTAEDAAFIETVNSRRVFARVTPLQKLQIVEALKRVGHYVAVTGDGVNDAPALQAANIGVAMGSGTDVTRNTASIVITDDNFASIVAGVEEGRFAYDNVRKVVYMLISTGVGEIILFVFALFTSHPLPLNAVQLLWLNVVTNGIQDVGLAFEGGEPGSLAKPPRKPHEHIFDRQMIQQTLVTAITIGAVAFGAWTYWNHIGYSEVAAGNLTLMLMVLFENVHVFNCRSETVSVFRVPVSRNKFIFGAVLLAQGVHIGALYIPWFQEMLGVQPLSLTEWIYCLLLASSVLVASEVFKWIKKRSLLSQMSHV